MQRWTLRITICIILGAISTVAISWACSLWSTAGKDLTRFEDNKGELYGFGYREEVHVLDFQGIDRNDPRDVVSSYQPRKMVGFQIWAYPERVFSGWPFEAMYYEIDVPDWSQSASSSEGKVWDLFIDNPLSQSASSNEEEEVVVGTYLDLSFMDTPLSNDTWRKVPTLPVWSGIALNTIIYAAIWFLLSLGFDAFRRSRRKKKGLCPYCSYNLRNNLTSGCPECGWNRDTSN